jgi:hypothetical protein
MSNSTSQPSEIAEPVSIHPVRIMTGNNFPKEIMRALDLPGQVQEFTLHVKKHEPVEVTVRYIPFVDPSDKNL